MPVSRDRPAVCERIPSTVIASLPLAANSGQYRATGAR
ncbi:Uncharacterised protein [Mycobacteroides abscessus subsp. abscessus]|nr:Uncharacterised protein [Mycobacteroides abscessus subsp. abscessus]SKV01746.1 Uncharacterised protein [Mycobacteroides abscessus subsp. abscessus]